MRLGIAVLALTLLAGCSSDGKRLDQLSADPVFAAKPPRATSLKTTETPASSYMEGGSRDPATVVLSFETSAGPEDVLLFYRGQAAKAGWNPRSFGALGIVDTWTKLYPDGSTAMLTLEELGHSGEWRLTAW